MDIEYRRAANITIIVIGIVLLCTVIFKYALGIFLPFLLAALLSGLISPAVKSISQKTHIPIKAVSAVFILLIFSSVVGLAYLACSRLIYEAGKLLERLAENPELVGDTVDSFIESFNLIGSKLSVIAKIFDSQMFKDVGVDIGELLNHGIESIISSVSSLVPTVTVSIVSSIPSVLLSALVFLLSAFYMTSEKGIVQGAFETCLPRKWQMRIPYFNDKIKQTLLGYSKAYFFIMVITFVEVFVGLSFLNVNYSFLIAALISIVDILPILGAGTVLIPWASIAFIRSDARLGAGLLILYAVTLIVRQIIEPKIIGTTLGIHPLATLASVYIGLRTIGILGIFVGPMIALLIREIFFKGEKKAEKAALVVSGQGEKNQR